MKSEGNMHIRNGKLNRSTSFTIYNMHYVNFRIQVWESIPWSGEFQKTKIETLVNTFNLHSNFTNAQEVWTLNWLQMKNLRVTYTHLHHFTMMFLTCKILYIFFPLYLTNYLIGLTFWAFPIGLKCVAWSGTKRDQ